MAKHTVVLSFILLGLWSTTTLGLDKGADREVSAITGVVVHAIGGPRCDGEKVVFDPVGKDAAYWNEWFKNEKTIGIHWVIGRDGKTEKGIPETQVANHAYGHNKNTVGIELVNNGDGKDPFPKPQVDSLVVLVKEIRKRYNIGSDKIYAHSAIDKGDPLPCGSPRRVDPGKALDLIDVIKRSTPD